jgi:8-oxo-dGTP pyrophosphatase MutT (NUDIX family)
MTASRIPIAMALLVRDGRALLVHRGPSRQAYPDRWGLAGGHVEPGELPHQAVGRECLEELGVHIEAPRLIPMTVADRTIETHAFLVTRWEAEPFNAAPEEHDDLRWFSPGELATLTLAHPECLPDILNAIQSALTESGAAAALTSCSGRRGVPARDDAVEYDR